METRLALASVEALRDPAVFALGLSTVSEQRREKVARLRADLALPPAESPSTRNISQFLGSLSEQSASFPGRLMESRAVFLRERSLAFRAASLARWDRIDFSQIFLAIAGFCSRK